MTLEIETFLPLPKPQVTFSGAAIDAKGRQLANVVELTGSERHYLVVIELPKVHCNDRDIEWAVHDDGEVTVEGKITEAEPLGITFYVPGPVD